MDRDVKQAILSNPGVGPSGKTITYLAMSSSDEVIRRLAVTHRNAPKRLIEIALCSSDPLMRTHVVYSPYIAVQQLINLAKDKNKQVAQAAREKLHGHQR